MSIISVNSKTILTPLTAKHAQTVYEAINEDRLYLREWLSFVDSIKSQKDILYFINSTKQPNGLNFAIFYEDTFAGLTGLKDIDRYNKKTEIGYWLREKFQNNGIMINSVKSLINFTFMNLDMNRIQILVAEKNIKSKNIPIKLGFHKEGILRDAEMLSCGSYTNLEVYSIIKKEFHTFL